MTTRTKTRRPPKVEAIPVLGGIRVLHLSSELKLELRSQLDMTRELFSRLVNVSVRTIAEVELNQKKVEKLLRNYVEVKRLVDALREVVEPEGLGEWFNTPNDAFGKLKPIEVVERGEIDRLWEMCYRLRSGMPV